MLKNAYFSHLFRHFWPKKIFFSKIRLRQFFGTIESYLDTKNQKKLWSGSSGIHPDVRTYGRTDGRTDGREQIYSPSQILWVGPKRCEKKVWNREKRCEIANLKEFLMENLCKPYIFLEHINGRIKFWKYFLKKVWKKVWNWWKKVWNRNYIEILNAKSVEYMYILEAFK